MHLLSSDPGLIKKAVETGAARLIPALALLLIAAGVGFAPHAHALKADRLAPMDVEADTLETLVNEGRAVLTGNVRINQGTLQVTAAKAEVSQNDKRQVSRAILTGTPATLAQDLDEGGRLNARARNIDYNVADGIVVLSGDVEIDQPRGVLRGQRVTYDLNTGRMTGGGAEGPGRVSLRINPDPPSDPP